jgi:hypothetical protein
VFQSYSPSGRFSASFVIWLLLGSVGIGIFALVYTMGLQWIPLIYITFLLTIAMGWCVGTLGQWVVKQGKVRNVGMGFGIAILLAIAGLAIKFSFQYYLAHKEEMEFIDGMRIEQLMQGIDDQTTAEQIKEFEKEVKQAAKDGYTFSAHIQSRVSHGWNIGKGGKGIPINGPFVYLIWLIEAGIILYFAVPKVLTAARQPFAEQLDTWADEAEIVMTLPVTNDEMVQKITAANSVQELLELPIPQTDQSNQFAVYAVNSIPGQDLEDAYLTVELHHYSVNSEGKTEVKTRPLANMVVITSQQRAQLRENAELMNEAIQAYRASQYESQSPNSESSTDSHDSQA